MREGDAIRGFEIISKPVDYGSLMLNRNMLICTGTEAWNTACPILNFFFYAGDVTNGISILPSYFAVVFTRTFVYTAVGC